jgi:YVTN family beta-propeller protein
MNLDHRHCPPVIKPTTVCLWFDCRAGWQLPQSSKHTSLKGRVRRFSAAIGVFIGILSLCGPIGFASAQTATAAVTTGSRPFSVAVNPLTNKVYVANAGSNNVTVIDGATNSTATVAAGTSPQSVAVNPVTNKIYVANQGSNNITVIDGATNNTATVAAGTSPLSVAVNPLTNKIYVANQGSGNVTVIDGATNNTAAVTAGSSPQAVAVNPATNKTYVANRGSGNVTVIDGATNSTTTVAAGTSPQSVAVNPAANKIYVANSGSGNVTMIDGASNNTTTVIAGTSPQSLVVNPVTNKIYVANSGSGNVTVIDGATNNATTVTAGTSPQSVAVNALTNKIYVANSGSGNVTVIDGATNATVTLTAGSGAISVAANPVTNKIYAANQGSGNVTVIDGATYLFTTVTAGNAPQAMDVNPVTNKIYVANVGDGTVTVIDGATNATATVPVGRAPYSVAVNPVTNKIYVANNTDNNVTVIDGATNVTATVSAGSNPYFVAVNPVTNKIYVANSGSNNVTVIDGATNSTATVATGLDPTAIAVNPATNKIYVVNYYSSYMTVIDGATNSTTKVTVGASSVAVDPVTNKIYVGGNASVIDGATNATGAYGVGAYSVAVNPVTNKIYIGDVGDRLRAIDGATNLQTYVLAGEVPKIAVNPVTNKIYVATVPFLADNPSGSYSFTVMDGATTSATVLAGLVIDAMAVNPVTNKIYVTASNAVTVVTEEQVQAVSPAPGITPLPNNLAMTATPTFNFTPPPGAQNVLYQVDTWQGAWSSSAPSFTATTSALQAGPHILYAYATDAQAGTSTQAGSPLVSNIAAYLFTVTAGPPEANATGGTPQSTPITTSFAIPLAVTVTGVDGQPVSGVVVTFTAPNSGASGTFPSNSTTATATTNSSGVATAPAFTANTTLGSYTVTASAAVGGSVGFALTNVNPMPTVSALSPAQATAGGSSMFLSVTGTNFVSGATVQWNGSPRTTTFGNSTSLAVSITAADLAAAGSFAVTVVNPAPSAGASTAVNFTVNNPVPVLTGAASTSATVGSASFLLNITGSNFVNGAVAFVNGNSRTTVYGSSNSLGMYFNTSDLASIGTLSITVMNPAPTTGASNALTFAVVNPVPAILVLSPASVAAGSAAFTLTVYGNNFVPGATVLWNGSARTTTFTSAQQLAAAINAADVATAATATVAVSNPSPGGGTSGGMSFPVGGTTQGTVTAQSVNAGGTAAAAVPIILALNSGVTVSALRLAVHVAPGAGSPAITGNLNFVPDAALPVPSGAPPTIVSTPTDVGVFFGAFNTPLSGTITLGVLQASIPASAAVGQTYAVQISGADAALNNVLNSAAVPLAAGPNGAITITPAYMIGDSFPHTADTVGSFGDGALNTLDLVEALRAVTNISRPVACSDRYDAMDAFPVDTSTARGGDGVLSTLDLVTTLKRVVSLDTSRPLRIARGQPCQEMQADRRHVEPVGPVGPVAGTIQVEGNAIYLAASVNLNLADLNLTGLALSLNLEEGRQGNFTRGDIAPSLVDVGLPGKVALAWLDGVKLTAGQRLLLGYVDGADRGSVLSVSADDASGHSVRIMWTNGSVR